MEDDQQREDGHAQQPQPRDVDDVKLALAQPLLLLGLFGVEEESGLQRLVHGPSYRRGARLVSLWPLPCSVRRVLETALDC